MLMWVASAAPCFGAVTPVLLDRAGGQRPLYIYVDARPPRELSDKS